MLKDFVDNVATNSHLRIERDLGDGFFKLRASEAQRRQAKQDIRCNEDIIVEMLRNSRDAGAKNIFVATHTQDNTRHIIIIDDGGGVPKTHYETIFEPYVTSKLNTLIEDKWGVHGRGMALYSIKLNANESRVINSGTGCGTSIYVKTIHFNEKTDQSTFPSFYVNDNSTMLVRGPKNILRIVAEFAIENRKQVNVYIGSPAEIASTIYNLSEKSDKVFSEPDEFTKLTELLSYSSDPREFREYAAEIGLVISERTARRIMDGEVGPQKNMLARIAEVGISAKDNKKQINKDILDIHNPIYKKPKVKLSDEDKSELVEKVKDAFKEIGEKYYLDTDISPKLSIRKGKLNISFDIVEI
ncbi:MAG: ATP-binding protein [Coriobacteriia bacterium]|nr:ATP-binding protein [Coriobacteriia bacterium]